MSFDKSEQQRITMISKLGLTLYTAGLAVTVLVTPYAPSIAQTRSAITIEISAQQHQAQQKKAAPATRSAQPRVAPQRVTPQRAAPRVVAPRRTTPRMVTQPKVTPRVVRQPKSTPKIVAPATAGRKLALPSAAPRVVTPQGTRAVTTSRLRGVPTRGVGRTVIRGQNYTAWRSGYRVRHGSGWRHLSRSEPWAQSPSARANIIPTLTFRRLDPIAKG